MSTEPAHGLEQIIEAAAERGAAKALAGKALERLVRMDEAEEMLNLSRTSIESFVRAGKLRRWAGSSKPLFRLSELQRFIAEEEER